ncbi:hypothetical protein [Nitrobacter hamburgensis]|nr:hypothetical protein [Nitrobacter hamburgensis]
MLFKKFRLHNERLAQVLSEKRAENDLAELSLIAEVARRTEEIENPERRAYVVSQFPPTLQKSPAIQAALLSGRRKPADPAP